MAQYIDLGSGGRVTTPDAAANSITGDLELIMYARADDWTPTSERYMFSKYVSTGNQRSYILGVQADGKPFIYYSTDGSAATKRASTSAWGFTDGVAHWIRATVDVDDGASGHVVAFYHSSDPVSTDPTSVSWTLHQTQTFAGVVSFFDSTADLAVNGIDAGANTLEMEVYEAVLINGLGGSVAARFDADDFTVGDGDLDTAVSSHTGETWTIRGVNAEVKADVGGQTVPVHYVGRV